MDEGREDARLSADVRLMDWLTGKVVTYVVDVLVVLVMVALVWAVWRLGVELYHAIASWGADSFKQLTVEVLTVFVFIEIFQALVAYLREYRFRVRYLVDVSLAFVLRELWIGLYGGKMEWQLVLAIAALVLALGAVRTLAVRYSPETIPEGGST